MTLETRCCIVGGGPAGMVLGWLLARSGIDVVVLEKHADFFRDFRGDTLHPSTLEIAYELGVLDELLQVPHTRVDHLDLDILGERVPGPDFRELSTHCKFVALMPQWDFLDFVRRQASRYPTFRLVLEAEAIGLARTDPRIAGVLATTPTGRLEVRADLVIGADGRDSVIRASAGLPLEEIGAPIDVLWLRIPRKTSDGGQVFGVFGADKLLVMLDRGDYWQCAYLIEKGGLAALRRRGLAAFHGDLLSIAPFLGRRVEHVASWADVKLLSVRVARLNRWWFPDGLCIGDAAHAMSPIGGVGINLAIQDAVAAANLLVEPLRRARVTADDLAAVQDQREDATRRIQGLQVAVHEHLIARILRGRGDRALRLTRFALRHLSVLRHYLAHTLGVGSLEHVETAEHRCDLRRVPVATVADSV